MDGTQRTSTHLDGTQHSSKYGLTPPHGGEGKVTQPPAGGVPLATPEDPVSRVSLDGYCPECTVKQGHRNTTVPYQGVEQPSRPFSPAGSLFQRVL